MRKKKFSKERFYLRLEAQNKNTGYVGFDTAHPQGDYSVSIDLDAWRDGLKRAGEALGILCSQLNESHKLVAEYLATEEGKAALAKELAKRKEKPIENLRADGLFFNIQNSLERPIPPLIPTPQIQWESRPETANLDTDSGSFAWYFLKLVALVACVVLLCEFLQKLSH